MLKIPPQPENIPPRERELDADDIADMQRSRQRLGNIHLTPAELIPPKSNTPEIDENYPTKSRQTVADLLTKVKRKRPQTIAQKDYHQARKLKQYDIAKIGQLSHQVHLLGNRGGRGHMPYSITVDQIAPTIDLPPALKDLSDAAYELISHQQQLRSTIGNPQLLTDLASEYPENYVRIRKPAQRQRIQSIAAVWALLFRLNQNAPIDRKLADNELTEIARQMFPPQIILGEHSNAAHWRRIFANPNNYNPGGAHSLALRLANLHKPVQFPRYEKIQRLTAQPLASKLLEINPATGKRPRHYLRPKDKPVTVTYLAAPSGKLTRQLWPPPNKAIVLLPRTIAGYQCYNRENLTKVKPTNKPG